MSKKQSPDKKNKDKGKKDNEQERLKQQAVKFQQQQAEAKDRLKVLENSGILNAYECTQLKNIDFLRSVCKNGLPDANIFEFAAQQILKYQKKMKQNNQKKQELNSFNRAALESPSRDRSPQRKESIEKVKPNLLPFKGDTKQQVLKGVHKQKSPVNDKEKKR